MSGVSLDTSGVVEFPSGGHTGPVWHAYRWPDLSPFEQGYVEAALHALIRIDFNEPTGKLPWKPMETRDIRFSDLAPETLAGIRKDCAAAKAKWSVFEIADAHPEHAHEARGLGRQFWDLRQRGNTEGFPPLTVTLGDDGKVRFQ